MAKTLRVALAQLNGFVGDCAGNAGKVLTALARADRAGADLCVTPEMILPGYPPEDLLLRRDFLAANLAALRRVVAGSRRHPRVLLIAGFAEPGSDGRLYNAAGLIRNGRLLGRYRKRLLPNYGVFDERRYFTSGRLSPFFRAGPTTIAVTICEDLWHPADPVARELEAGRPGLIVNLSASPYEIGKLRTREAVIGGHARAGGAPLVYVNLVGGQDELVFDGQSLVFDGRGRVVARGVPFAEELLLADVRVGEASPAVEGLDLPAFPVRARTRLPRVTRRRPPPAVEEAYGALVLGIRDYAAKNGFAGAVLGLSGGIDSSLTATLAADALGSDRVTGVRLPSRYTSEASEEDARVLAERLGIRCWRLPIEDVFGAYLRTLAAHLPADERDLTRQNLQARVRGALLMALSNRYGWLLLATGNKSEMSVGYSTLYGDLAGGFAPLKDVPKDLVYGLSRWRNARGPGRPVPARVFAKAPTAELRPNQKDSDSLPPYPVLDRILGAYVEENLAVGEIARRRLPEATARTVARMVERSEYKRRQSPPGVKIRSRAFGKDRRNPISHGFKPWEAI